MFSFSRLFAAHAAQTWGRTPSVEFDACNELAERFGYNAGPQHALLPAKALQTRAALLDSSISGLAGGNLMDVDNIAFVLPALQPQSTVMKLGASVSMAARGTHIVPVVGASVAPVWQPTESTSVGESGLTFTAKVGISRQLICWGTASRQLLLQSNFDEVFVRELRRAAAAEIDRVALAGSGSSGEPTGILYSGAQSFNESQVTLGGLRLAQEQCASLDADTGNRGYALDHITARILATRARVTNSDRMMLEGPSADGIIEGCRSLATTNLSATIVYSGAWEHVHVVQWAPAEIAIDPATNFSKGWVSFRIIIPCDILVLRPSAFSVCQGAS